MPGVIQANPDADNPWLSPRPRQKRKDVQITPDKSIDDGATFRRRRGGSASSSNSASELAPAPLHEPSYRKTKLPAGFQRKDDGIYFKSGDSSAVRICDVIHFVAQTRDESGSSWGILLEWDDKDDRQHRWAMPKSLLAGDAREIRAALLDRGFYISTSSYERSKFSELLASAVVDGRATAVNSLGWSGEAFALPGRTIGDSPEHRVIYQGADTADNPYQCKGDISDWQEGVARYAVGNSRLSLSIAAAFVGPLLELLGEEGGGINLVGPSSIGKSTALFVAGSVWGDPTFVRQWRATSNGLEGVCVQHNQTLLCLDELAQLDPREAGNIAYMIANGMGKARANRVGGLRSSASWKVMFLSSGEISLSDLAGHDSRGAKRSAAGQEVRILDINADAASGLGLFEVLHDELSAEEMARLVKSNAGKFYGVAGPEFVARLCGDHAQIISDVKKDLEVFIANHVPPNANGQVARAARRFALVAAAGELAVRIGILPWPEGEATAACAKIFGEWTIGRGGVGSAEDRNAIAKVRAFLEQHGGSRFEHVEGDEYQRIHNRAGFWREGDNGREYLFLAETWKNEVCAGMNASRVATVLADKGLLLRDSAGKNSVSVTLPAGIGKSRCYVVNASIFDCEAGG